MKKLILYLSRDHMTQTGFVIGFVVGGIVAFGCIWVAG
jgi:hypothetical protein